MKRYVYFGISIGVIVGVAVLFIYRTSTFQTEPATQTFQIAEFGGVSLRLEYATTSTERERGLGGRKSIPDGFAMLFVFPKDDYYGFWMKDTLVPLDIFWLDNKGQVITIAESVSPSTYPNVFYPSEPARYVLETAAGFARAHNIANGTPLLLKSSPIVSQ